MTLEELLQKAKREEPDIALSDARIKKALKAETGAKPKFHKGVYGRKHDTYTCGNCGCELPKDVLQNYCWNCGYAVLWDSPRCLTGVK